MNRIKGEIIVSFVSTVSPRPLGCRLSTADVSFEVGFRRSCRRPVRKYPCQINPAILLEDIDNPAHRELQRWCSTQYQEDGDKMKCPTCSTEIAEVFQQLFTTMDADRNQLKAPQPFAYSLLWRRDNEYADIKVYPSWMRCPKCGEVLVRVSRIRTERKRSHTPMFGDQYMPVEATETWIAVPRREKLTELDSRIPADMARDFAEAERILPDSHRMSAVLSRRILADLLKNYAGLKHYGLNERINKFIEDPQHPSALRENLHYLRELGDFSAHTMTDSEDRVIDVTPEEAEWTLRVVMDCHGTF